MKKLLLLTVVFTTCYCAGNAQSTRFGFTAGTVFANYQSKGGGVSENLNSKTGLTAGILVDIPSGKYFSFQPALNFVQKGAKDEETSGGVTYKTKLNINCIELPLNLLYNASGNTGNFFIGAGPSLAFSLSGKTKFEDGTNSTSENIKFGNGDDDDIKGLDLGANVITGYCFPNGLFLSVNYNTGLSNLAPGSSSDVKLTSHYFGIKLGILLKGNGKK